MLSELLPVVAGRGGHTVSDGGWLLAHRGLSIVKPGGISCAQSGQFRGHAAGQNQLVACVYLSLVSLVQVAVASDGMGHLAGDPYADTVLLGG